MMSNYNYYNIFIIAFSAVEERQYKTGVNILYVKVTWLLNEKIGTTPVTSR